MLKGWPSHPGFTTKQLLEVRDIRSVGAKTGMNNGPLLCFDIDGTSALKLACSLGLDPLEVRTWQVHRDNNPSRLKVLFRPTPQQIAQLTEGEFQSRTQTAEKTETNKGEALEVFFYGGRQVIVLGEHPSSGGSYFWPDGLGPEAISAPPDAWWQYARDLAAKTQHNISAGGKHSSTRNPTRRLDPCPICGRHSGNGNGLWCEETSNGLIFCMPGSTFNADPSGSMKLGSVVNGYALVKRTTRHGFDYLTFAPNRYRRHRHFRPTSYLSTERRRAHRG